MIRQLNTLHHVRDVLNRIPELNGNVFRVVQREGRDGFEYPTVVYTVTDGVTQTGWDGEDVTLEIELSFRGHDDDELDIVAQKAQVLFTDDARAISVGPATDAWDDETQLSVRLVSITIK